MKNKKTIEKCEEEEFSPYCDSCNHCGYIGCCGIGNFLYTHVLGQTNCKNELGVLNEIIDCCNEEWDRKESYFTEKEYRRRVKELKLDKSKLS